MKSVDVLKYLVDLDIAELGYYKGVIEGLLVFKTNLIKCADEVSGGVVSNV